MGSLDCRVLSEQHPPPSPQLPFDVYSHLFFAVTGMQVKFWLGNAAQS